MSNLWPGSDSIFVVVATMGCLVCVFRNKAMAMNSRTAFAATCTGVAAALVILRLACKFQRARLNCKDYPVVCSSKEAGSITSN